MRFKIWPNVYFNLQRAVLPFLSMCFKGFIDTNYVDDDDDIDDDEELTNVDGVPELPV